MRFTDVSRALAAAAIIGAATPAAAFNCYLIVDRANEVIYQGVTSPIDLSDDGTAARDALRGRGQQLIAMDAERCPEIDRGRIGGGATASVEEIVAGMRSAVPFGAPLTRARPAGGGGISLPQITVPRASGGGVSPAVPPSGMSVRY